MEIITGYTGVNHVTSADDASLHRGIIGADDYVLEVGNEFSASIIDNNTVRVLDGDLVIQGHQARIRANDYNEVTIDNGTAGQKRNDLIVARYLKNNETGIESISLAVIKGTPGVTAVDPEIVQDDLKIGGAQRDYPLYRTTLDGISLASLTSLFNVIPNFSTHLADKTSAHGIDTKADIEQEAWKNPTLLNGWIPYDTNPYFNVAYKKNTLGYVSIVGLIKVGVMTQGTYLFELPVGYRPLASMILPVACSGGFGIIEISGNGVVHINNIPSNEWVSLVLPPFQAEG